MIPRSKAYLFPSICIDWSLITKKTKRLFGCALSLTIKSKSIKEISTM